MTRIAAATVVLSLVVGPAAPLALADPAGTASVGPETSGRGAWSGERMRGAHERLKDVIPAPRTGRPHA